MPADTPEDDKPKASPWGDEPANKQAPRPQNGNPFGREHGPRDTTAGKSNSPATPPRRPPGIGNMGSNGSNSSNNSQPDIEDLVRRSREKLKQMMPNNIAGDPDNLRTTGVIIGVVLIAILWLATGFYRVQEGQLGVVLRFGEVNRTAQPGLRYHLPYPIETALTPNVTFENRIEIGFRSPDAHTAAGMAADDSDNAAQADRSVPDESTMLTADQNIVDLDFAVTWVVKDPSLFLFEIRDPETTVKRAAESAMRESIGQTEIQDALTGARDQVQEDTKTLLQQILDSYHSGVEIVRVELLRVNPPGPVVDAFNDVQRAEADRERLRNEAESYRNKIIPEARGEAEKLRNEADGYRQQVVNEAKGEASRFAQVLIAYDTAREVTMQRLYLSTMEQVLKGANKIVLDGGHGNAVPYLPINLPTLKAALPAPMAAPTAQPQMSSLQMSGPRILGPAISPDMTEGGR